jgi:hypothetical protein
MAQQLVAVGGNQRMFAAEANSTYIPLQNQLVLTNP